MTGLWVAIVVVALVILAMVAAKRSKHPEQTAGHHDDPPPRTNERPAGADAEDPIGRGSRTDADLPPKPT